MYSNSLLFGILFLAIFLIGMAIGAVIALKRGFYPALVRLALVVLCLLLAIPITNAIAGALSGVSEQLISTVLGDLSAQVAQHSPSTLTLMHRFPIAVAAPILFILIFCLLRLLTLILFRLVRALLPTNSSLPFRVLGGVTGAITSLVCLWAIWLPLWGMLNITHQTVLPICEIPSEQNAKLQTTITQIDSADNDILAPAIYNFTTELFTNQGQSKLYDSLTKIEFQEDQLYLSKEVQQISHTAINTLTFVGTIPNDFKISDINRDHITSLYALCDDLEQSELLKSILAEWLSSAVHTWENDETFFGITDPAAKTAYKPVIHALYHFLGTTNDELLVDDLRLFIDVLDIAIDYHLLDTRQTDLIKTFGSDTFADDLTAPLDGNDRLRVTLANLTASLTGAWANGSDYQGMAEPALNATYRAMLHACYGFLATTDESLIASDIQTISTLSSMLNQKTSAPNILMDDGFLKDFNLFLSENTRFRQHFVTWFIPVCHSWSKGEAYDGLESPATNELVAPVVSEMFGILATTNESLIHDDLTAMTEIMAILRNYNAYHSAQDGKQMANIIKDSHFASDLHQCLGRHDRFSPLRKTITSIGLSAISSQLTTALPDSVMLTDISTSVSQTINTTTTQTDDERLKAINTTVNSILIQNKIDAPAGVTDIISEIVYEEFSQKTSVQGEDIRSYLTAVYQHTGNLDDFFK